MNPLKSRQQESWRWGGVKRSRRIAKLAVAVYAAVLVYGSLAPFELQFPDPGPAAPATAEGAPGGDIISRRDVVSNIALYVPFGILTALLAQQRGWGKLMTSVFVLASTAALSSVVECLQVFIVSRVSSLLDVVCDVIGAGIGGVLYVPEASIGRRLLTAVRRELNESPTSVLVLGAMAAAAMICLVPFDLTFDISHLADAVKSAQTVPFAAHEKLAGDVASSAGAVKGWDIEAERTRVGQLRALWTLRLNYVADVFLFMTLAMCFVHHYRCIGRGSITAAGLAMAGAGVIGVGITCMGLVVRSVGFDATHLLTRGAGAILGTVLYGVAFDCKRGEVTVVAVAAGALVCGAMIGARSLSPFVFKSGPIEWASKVEWIPFSSYALARLPAAVLDGTHKCARFLALGAFVALWTVRRRRDCGRGARLRWAVAAMAGVATLEVAQVWIPARVPALTDVLLAGAGVWVGGTMCLAVRHAFHGHAAGMTTGRVTLNVEIPAPRGQGGETGQGRRAHAQPPV